MRSVLSFVEYSGGHFDGWDTNAVRFIYTQESSKRRRVATCILISHVFKKVAVHSSCADLSYAVSRVIVITIASSASTVVSPL